MLAGEEAFWSMARKEFKYCLREWVGDGVASAIPKRRPSPTLPLNRQDELYLTQSVRHSLSRLRHLLHRLAQRAAQAKRCVALTSLRAGCLADALRVLSSDLWQTLQVVTPASKPIGRRKKAEVYQCECSPEARAFGRSS